MLSLGVNEVSGENISLEGITDPNCKELEGVPNSGALIAFTDAFTANDAEVLSEARDRLVEEMGLDAVVEASGVASNFQCMNRIADCLSINPEENWADDNEEMHDDELYEFEKEITEKLGFNEIVSSTNPKHREN